MKKTFLFLIFITTLPIFSSAEVINILFPVQTSHTLSEHSSIINSDNSTKSSSSGGISFRYIGDSGIGFGFTNINVDYFEDESGRGFQERHIKYRALELSYSISLLTFGLGNILDGSMTEEILTYSPSSILLTKKKIYQTSGTTSFAQIHFKIYEMGSLIIGYHTSSLNLKSNSSSATGTINNLMLGFQFPI